MISLGCSGWYYADWIGPFYPPGTKNYLSYYSDHFNSVEINVTFYRPVGEKQIRSWISQVANKKEFTFSVKVPRQITHETLIDSPEDAIYLAKKFMEEIMPLQSSGKLGAILFQMPPYFRKTQMTNLMDVLSQVRLGDTRGFVEFRNSELYTDAEARSMLNGSGFDTAVIDSPDKSVAATFHPSNGHTYFRFHGRNSAAWYSRHEDPSERYDYLYTGKELTELSNYITKSIEAGDEVFVYFNNHPSGKATSNASEVAEILGVPHRDFQRRLF